MRGICEKIEQTMSIWKSFPASIDVLWTLCYTERRYKEGYP